MDASSIRTDRLQLIAVEPFHAQALLRDKREFAEVLGVAVPEGWPQFPEAFSAPDGGPRRSERPPTDWRDYFFVHPQESALVGNGGFTGDPDDSGEVEIGYEIAPEHQSRGYATEAALAMIGYAFAHDEVSAVVAHTLGETNASNAVLRKAGMSFVAEMDDDEVGKVWRWRISKKEYRPEGTERNTS